MSLIDILPIDPRLQLPVPWFVHRPDGWEPGDPIDFRIADAYKLPLAFRDDLCWVCGSKLALTRCVVVGPMCLITCASAEPQMHPGCAEWSACHCPFLSRPAMKRSPRAMPEEARPAGGEPIRRNPGVAVVGYLRRKLKVESHANGLLFRLPKKFLRLDFYAEGRKASFDEVRESVRTGLPILFEQARKGGEEEVAALKAEIVRVGELLAEHFGQRAERAA